MQNCYVNFNSKLYNIIQQQSNRQKLQQQTIMMKAFDLGQLRKTARVNDPTRSYSEIHKSPLKNSVHQNSVSSQNYQTYYLSRWGKNIDTKSQNNNKQSSQSTPWVNIGQGIYSVSVGQQHVLILNNKNQCFAYGNNSYGQLAQDSDVVARPTQISAFKQMKIAAVYSGAYHSFILNAKGQLYAFGLNLKGQLGVGSYSNKKKPTLVYSVLPGGIKNPKAQFFLQTNEYKKNVKRSHIRSRNQGQLANIQNLLQKFDSETKESDQFQPSDSFLLNSDESIVKVSCGPLHTAVLTNKNRLFVCGYGQKYALGTGNQKTICDFEQVKIRTNCNSNTSSGTNNSSISSNKIQKIQCGNSSLAVILNGKVYITGKLSGMTFQTFTPVSIINSKNSLSYPSQQAVDLKICQKSMIILTKRGDVYQLGQCFKQTGQKYLAQTPKKIQKLSGIKQIFNGSNEYFAFTQNKQIYGWGQNKHSQITALSDQKYIYYPKNLKVPIPYTSQSINVVSSNGTTFLLSTKPMEIDYEKFRQDINSNNEKQQNNFEQRKKDKCNRTISYSNICGIQQRNYLNQRGIKPRMFNANMEIDFSQIKIQNQISQGGYGIIYKGTWRQTTVAIKMFKIQSQSAVKDFFSQCAAMQVLRHPNIVMFLGACTKSPNYAIVLQYCTRGSLWSTIQNLDIQLSWQDRRRFAIQTAKGVHYLHSCSPPIIHRDLKSLNLLLDDSNHIKLADFGWTKNLDNYMTGKIGTYQWMAPQVIASQKYSEKADVFSYGIILWQIASRQPPFKHLQGLQVSIQVLNNDLRPTIPKKTPQSFAKLMKKCWERDPNKRPSFKQIIKQLQSMKL